MILHSIPFMFFCIAVFWPAWVWPACITGVVAIWIVFGLYVFTND